MFLHEDSEMFADIIREVNIRTGIPSNIIEKDYYVTMILYLLASKEPGIVFKGGTSLSKCYKLIDRFSEDIDITFTEHIGEGRRKKLKYNVIQPVSELLHMPISNWNLTESDKDYNCYKFDYTSVLDDVSEVGIIPPTIKVETALVSYAFPTEICQISSIIYDTLKDDLTDIINNYELAPFNMQVQSVIRTFIDKIFALCDYYIQNKSKRYSRHLYDVCKLYPNIKINESFIGMLEQVREHRSHLSICPSAQKNIDIKALIYEYLDNDFYKSDYESVTATLIADNVKYETAKETLKMIADKLF